MLSISLFFGVLMVVCVSVMWLIRVRLLVVSMVGLVFMLWIELWLLLKVMVKLLWLVVF